MKNSPCCADDARGGLFKKIKSKYILDFILNYLSKFIFL